MRVLSPELRVIDIIEAVELIGGEMVGVFGMRDGGAKHGCNSGVRRFKCDIE